MNRLFQYIMLLLSLIFCLSSTTTANTTYKLKFGEDLRSVALKYGLPEGVLIDLNPNAPTRFNQKKNVAEAVLMSQGMKIIIPGNAKMSKSWDKDLEEEIFLENMRLTFADKELIKNVVENKKWNKKLYDPFLKRMFNDFGYRKYKPELGETLAVIGLRYDNGLLAFEHVNPALASYMMHVFPKNIFKGSSFKPLVSLEKLTIVFPKKLKLLADHTTSKKLWSVNIANNISSSDGAFTKQYNYTINNSTALFRYRHAWYYYGAKKNQWWRVMHEIERIAEDGDDGTLAAAGITAENLEKSYKSAARHDRRIEEKKARRKQFWTEFGLGLLQVAAQTTQIVLDAYVGVPNFGYPAFNMPVFTMSPGFYSMPNMNYSLPPLDFSNINAGMNAAIITANSSNWLNQSWFDFQNSMQNMFPYSFNELQNMSLPSFNAQFGFNFDNAQFDATMTNWADQGMTANFGPASFDDTDAGGANGDWERYYRDQYARWEHRVQSTYNTLTNLGTRGTSSYGNPVGTTGSMGNPGGSLVRMKMTFLDEQKQLRNIRNEAAQKGIHIPQSSWENAVVNIQQ